jgi:hypothetical protein
MSKRIAPPTAMEKLCDLYESKNPLFPFVVIGMNAAGLGVVDRLISKRANDFAFKQVHTLISEMSRRIDLSLVEPKSDAFVPGVNLTMRSILETQSTEKVKRFAAILSPTWNADAKWDETAQTLKIVASLDDSHVVILSKVKQWSGTAREDAVTFTIGPNAFKDCNTLATAVPGVDPMLLTSCVADLTALGLLKADFVVDPLDTYRNAKSDDPVAAPAELPAGYKLTDLGAWILKRFDAL